MQNAPNAPSPCCILALLQIPHRDDYYYPSGAELPFWKSNVMTAMIFQHFITCVRSNAASCKFQQPYRKSSKMRYQKAFVAAVDLLGLMLVYLASRDRLRTICAISGYVSSCTAVWVPFGNTEICYVLCEKWINEMRVSWLTVQEMAR